MSSKRRKLNFNKCDQCRTDKQKCEPVEREWPAQKCDRCIKYNYACSGNSKVAGKTSGPSDGNASSGPKRERTTMEYLQALAYLSELQQTVWNAKKRQERDLLCVPVPSDRDSKRIRAINDFYKAVCGETCAIMDGCERRAGELRRNGQLWEALVVYQKLLALKELREAVDCPILGAADHIHLKIAQLYEELGNTWEAQKSYEKHDCSEFPRDGPINSHEHPEWSDSIIVGLLNIDHPMAASVCPILRRLARLGIARVCPDILDEILEAGANIPKESKEVDALLHTALISECPTKQVELLVTRGADIHSRNRMCLSPLGIVFKRLFCASYDADKMNYSSINPKILKALELIELFLEWGADLDPYNGVTIIALHKAVQFGCLGVVKKMIASGVDVNALEPRRNSTVLHAAVMGNSTIAPDIIQLLFDAGLKQHIPQAVDIRGGTAFHALFRGIERWDGTLMHSAAVIRLLVAKGVPLSKHDNDGRTALHWAFLRARSCDHEAVRELLVQGADVSAIDNEGGSPLHNASTYFVSLEEEASRQLKSIWLLLSYGADPLLLDKYGITPLAAAEKNKNKKAVDLMRYWPNSMTWPTDMSTDDLTVARPSSLFMFDGGPQARF